MSHSLPRHTWPNSSALPPFQKDVTTRQALHLFSWIFRLKWQREWRHMAARAYKRGGDPVAPQRATGLCRPRGGRQAPVARWGGDRLPPFFFFSRDFVANLEKKNLHFGPVALWEGDRGIFLKFSKMDIYFWNFNFFKYKKEKTTQFALTALHCCCWWSVRGPMQLL